MATAAPLFANSSTAASPMPDEPPVTRTVLPERSAPKVCSPSHNRNSGAVLPSTHPEVRAKRASKDATLPTQRPTGRCVLRGSLRSHLSMRRVEMPPDVLGAPPPLTRLASPSRPLPALRGEVASLDLRARGLDDLGPFLDLGLDEGAELVGLVGPDLAADVGEALLQLGVGERLQHLGVELGDDLGRGLRRREDRKPA